MGMLDVLILFRFRAFRARLGCWNGGCFSGGSMRFMCIFLFLLLLSLVVFVGIVCVMVMVEVLFDVMV